ncbi:MAG: DUF4234 domain-containing protein [Planctomycetota bacterium]|nr:DUF4234 domain-containing protein [Planctomycetota bacterium]
MVVVCPNCHTRLKLTRLPCAQCKNPIEVDANLVAGKPVMICPQCKAQQVIGRLKCTKCQTMINLAAGQKPSAPTAAPKAAPPSAAAPVPAPVSQPDPPAAAPPPPAPPAPEAPAAPAAAGDVPVFENSPGLVLILSIVTLGFYLLYWCPKAAAVINAVTTGKKIGSVMAVLAGIACCTPALIKFYWRAAVALGLSRGLMVLLAFLPPIAATVVQGNINKLYEGRS